MSHFRFLVFFIAALSFGTAFGETTNKTEEAISPQEVMEAALYGKDETIDNALKQGYQTDTSDPEGRTALMYAAYNGQTNIVQKLIEAGADVNHQDNTGSTALMLGASGSSTETLKLLLDAGARINVADSNEHFTALMWAAAEGQADNVVLLLERGADSALQDVDGDTARSFALKAGHYAAVRAIDHAAKASKEEPSPENQ